METKEIIARRVALELTEGLVVNLGIGLPTMVAQFVPKSLGVIFHSENGFLGLGPLEGKPSLGVVNAGGVPCGLVAGASIFDSATSFAIIRGGHLDVTVLGGLQVDQEGNLANWMVPGQMIPGMGGAMDLVNGAKKVIVAMEHCTKDGSHRLLKKCTLPLTAKARVSMVITEKAVFEFNEFGMKLIEIMPGVTLDEIQATTEANFTVR